jgi:hypothetical protein
VGVRQSLLLQQLVLDKVNVDAHQFMADPFFTDYLQVTAVEEEMHIVVAMKVRREMIIELHTHHVTYKTLPADPTPPGDDIFTLLSVK